MQLGNAEDAPHSCYIRRPMLVCCLVVNAPHRRNPCSGCKNLRLARELDLWGSWTLSSRMLHVVATQYTAKFIVLGNAEDAPHNFYILTQCWFAVMVVNAHPP